MLVLEVVSIMKGEKSRIIHDSQQQRKKKKKKFCRKFSGLGDSTVGGDGSYGVTVYLRNLASAHGSQVYCSSGLLVTSDPGKEV